MMHDRFIVVDYGEKGVRVYHYGASSKDAGKGLMVISEVIGELAKRSIDMLVGALLNNSELDLR